MSHSELSPKARLRLYRSYLLDELMADPFVSELFTVSVLSSAEMEQLTDTRKRRDRRQLAAEFVDILRHKPDWGIKKFFGLLKDHEDWQPQIYQHLFSGDVKEPTLKSLPGLDPSSSHFRDRVSLPSLITEQGRSVSRFDLMVSSLKPSLYLHRLREIGLIDDVEQDKLNAMQSELERSWELVHMILPGKGLEAWCEFWKVVKVVDCEGRLGQSSGISTSASSVFTQGKQKVQSRRTHIAFSKFERRTRFWKIPVSTKAVSKSDRLKARQETLKHKQLRQDALKRKRLILKRWHCKVVHSEGGLGQSSGISTPASPVSSTRKQKIPSRRKLKAHSKVERRSRSASRSTEAVSKNALLYFKKEQKQEVLERKHLILSECFGLFKIKKEQIKFKFLSRQKRPKHRRKWIDKGEDHVVYFDTESVLVCLIADGVEPNDIDDVEPSVKSIIEGTLDLPSGRIRQSPAEKINSALVVFHMGIDICFSLLNACSTRRTELGLALQTALPGLKEAELRIGSLPPVKVFSVSREELRPEFVSEGTPQAVTKVASTFNLNHSRSVLLSQMPVHLSQLKLQIMRLFDKVDIVTDEIEQTGTKTQPFKERLKHLQDTEMLRTEVLRGSLVVSLGNVAVGSGDSDVACLSQVGTKQVELETLVQDLAVASNVAVTAMTQRQEDLVEKVAKLAYRCEQQMTDIQTRIGILQLVISEKAELSLRLAVSRNDVEMSEKLLEGGANPNVVDKDPDKCQTSLLQVAAVKGSVEMVKLLLKYNTDVNYRDNKGRTALHSAAVGPRGFPQLHQSERVRVAKILLENKADACVVDEDGKRPYDLATGDLKRMLRKAYEDQMNAVLSFSEGTVEPSAMKLCVIGSEGSGKSTFTKSVKQGKLKSMFTDESQHDDPYCIEQRTVGIAVSTVDVPGVGRVSVYDVGGQNQFHKTHGFFFLANAFFILLLGLAIGGEIRNPRLLYIEAKYWLCFMRASIDKRSIPTVIMAASHLDHCPQGGEILQQLADRLRRVFAGKIIISLNSFALDCRKGSSKQMTDLRQYLRDLKKQNKVLSPRLCEPVVTKVLPALRQQQQDLFIDTSQLVAAIKEQSPMQDQGTIDKVISFLNDCSELLLFGVLTILDIPFLCMYIIGPLMAPDNFPYHLEGRHNGVMTKEHILHVLEAFQASHKKSFAVNIDIIIRLAKALELAFAVEGKPNTFLFPSHLPIKELSVMWKDDPTKLVYVGRQAYCFFHTSVFSPGAFSFFQCRANVRLDQQAQLWRDGIIVERAETVQGHVQCLVYTSKPLGAVNFVCRCAMGSETECMALLRDVMALWKDVIEDHSPGTEYQVGYLSRQHLTEHRKEVAVYSQEQVDEAIEKGPEAAVRRVIRDDEVVVESLSDLMVFMTPRPAREQYPSPEAFSTVFQAIVSCGQVQWYELALRVGYKTPQIESLTHDKPMKSGKFLTIIQHKIDEVGVQAAEEAFLDACHNLPYPIYAEVMEAASSRW